MIRSVIRQPRGRRWAIVPHVDLGHSGVLNRKMIRAGSPWLLYREGLYWIKSKSSKEDPGFPHVRDHGSMAKYYGCEKEGQDRGWIICIHIHTDTCM